MPACTTPLLRPVWCMATARPSTPAPTIPTRCRLTGPLPFRCSLPTAHYRDSEDTCRRSFQPVDEGAALRVEVLHGAEGAACLFLKRGRRKGVLRLYSS